MVDKCLGHQRIAAASLAAAIAPTIPAGTREIHMQCDTNNVRYTLTGDNPTSTTGMTLFSGSNQHTIIRLSQSLHNIKFILESGSPNLNLTYFGQSDS